MSPAEMVIAVLKIAQRYDDAVVIYIGEHGGRPVLLADADQVWPDCHDPDAICEGAGEYRTVAYIDNTNGEIEWFDPTRAGHR